MSAADFADLKPDADMRDLARWVSDGIAHYEGSLGTHPDWAALRTETQEIVIRLAGVQGLICGALLMLRECSPASYYSSIRRAELIADYGGMRHKLIHDICSIYCRGTIIAKEMPNKRGGRPIKLMPDYNVPAPPPSQPKELAEWKTERTEFHIAIQIFEAKKRTGRFEGLKKLVDEATSADFLSADGDHEQRIRRLAETLWERKDLYVTRGLRAALDGAPRWSLTDRGF